MGRSFRTSEYERLRKWIEQEGFDREQFEANWVNVDGSHHTPSRSQDGLLDQFQEQGVFGEEDRDNMVVIQRREVQRARQAPITSNMANLLPAKRKSVVQRVKRRDSKGRFTQVYTDTKHKKHVERQRRYRQKKKKIK